jgi:glycosyltransferase involved in cell wall biosynthesis
MRLVRVAVNAEQLLYRSPGGIGRYTAQLLTVLPAAFPEDRTAPFVALHRRHQVRAALRDFGVGTTVASEVTVLSLPRPILYEAWLRVGRPRLPAFDGAELVHAPSLAVPPRPKVPLVVTVHDAAVELFPESFPARGRQFHRMGLAAAAERADLVITVTAAAADEIVTHSSIPEDRIRVVHHGVEAASIEPSVRQLVLANHGLAGRPYVLWVGSLEPRKAVGTVVAAMAELRRARRHVDVQLVLAGYEGWLNDDVVGPEDRAALGSALHQIGRVPERDLWSLYGGATVFAFPSRHEGFGLPVIEAMAEGVPVLASDIPAIREVSGGAARLVAPGDVKEWADALDQLLSDQTTRQQMAVAGRARSERFSIGAFAASTRAVYREACGR